MGVGLVITLVALSALGVGGLGFVAGRATAPGDAEELAEVRGLVEAQGATLAELAEAASRPVVIDAEIRETLAETPPQCRSGQDPAGLACAWATCLQYGQSSAQRPECRAVEAAYLSSMAQPAE
jgi:hypothetical protein